MMHHLYWNMHSCCCYSRNCCQTPRVGPSHGSIWLMLGGSARKPLEVMYLPPTKVSPCHGTWWHVTEQLAVLAIVAASYPLVASVGGSTLHLSSLRASPSPLGWFM